MAPVEETFYILSSRNHDKLLEIRPFTYFHQGTVTNFWKLLSGKTDAFLTQENQNIQTTKKSFPKETLFPLTVKCTAVDPMKSMAPINKLGRLL